MLPCTLGPEQTDAFFSHSIFFPPFWEKLDWDSADTTYILTYSTLKNPSSVSDWLLLRFKFSRGNQWQPIRGTIRKSLMLPHQYRICSLKPRRSLHMFPGMLSGVRIKIRTASPQGKPLYFVTVGGHTPFHRALHTGVLSVTGIFSLPARLLHLDFLAT